MEIPTGAVCIRNALVWTGGQEPRVFSGGVLCRGGKIEALGSDAEAGAKFMGAESIDAGGRLLVPGFINAHMHLYSALARGLSVPGEPAECFAHILERLWWKLDAALEPEDIAAGADLMLYEGLRAGVTTVIDHHASFGAIEFSLDALLESARMIGVRLSTCFEVSDRHGKKKSRAALAENLRFAASCKDSDDARAMLGLHASFTLSDDTLAACREAALSEKLPAHVHLAEDQLDNRDARQRGCKGAADRLLKSGVLTPGSLAIHCVHTRAGDWKRLRAAGVSVVCNPQSNMNNAVGAAPLEKMLAAGIEVGIGTDGMEADVREELRTALLLGRHQAKDPRRMWPEAAALFDNNRKIASRLFGSSLGQISTGAPADLVVLDYIPPTPIEAGNFIGHLLFGFGRLPAWAVVCRGRTRILRGQPLDLDPARIAARARERAQGLWRRL